MELTNGEGVDSAIEALGSEQTLQNAIKVTKPGGTISNAGYHGKGEYVSNSASGLGRRHGGENYPYRSLSGRPVTNGASYPVASDGAHRSHLMTTHTFEFDALDKAFEVMDKKLDGVMKPLIVF